MRQAVLGHTWLGVQLLCVLLKSLLLASPLTALQEAS